MILEKGYTGGDVINVIFVIVTGSMALGEVSPCITTAFVTGQAAAFKMFEAIERKPKIDAYLSDGKRFDDVQGEIELRDVDFSYPSRRHQQIFCGFSLIIPSRTTTALVGGSGSGKSTVISLIERFYDPNAGEVLIDGVNLKEFQLKWIRRKISLVSQDLLLLSWKIYCRVKMKQLSTRSERQFSLLMPPNLLISYPRDLTQWLENMVLFYPGDKSKVSQ